MTVTCPSCAGDNEEGKRFCGDCGHALALVCPTCGAAVEAGKRFCGDCGAAVAVAAPTEAASEPVPARGPVAERRLTTVLFGDLVGFTTLSESRDAEDVRELLSQYFAMAATVVARYGGTIEKFIGDAVMAVWGVPVAHEDDAERAVRAGLDLVSGVVALGERVGLAGLSLRVGVLTGEVAVTLGAIGEGMVAGDAVNTASRIQSVAAPGQVLVDDTTRSLTVAALSYTDAGEHLLKGKAAPVRLHAAGAVMANVGGAQRVDGLEAPFTGRDHELRLVKELFHAAIDERRPRLVAVSGLAGVGKTRLAWELEKYIDGIADPVRWHRSRALSYGDGVSFWPIAEMVRARLGLTADEPAAVVDTKLAALLETVVGDAAEREWLRPRLSALLGREAGGYGRDDLFSAWSTFFERIGDGDCVVLVLDDMQHADADLLDFIEHLLESSRYPLFVLTLARPELIEARVGWASGRRATPVHLEPLGESAMAAILDGLVDGLPDAARDALLERSEGIPVYALEMVRALIDRDVVIPRDGRYVVAPDAEERVDLAAIDAPPSLQALIAARLDALTPDERRLVQEGAVHGLAFSREGIGATSSVADLDVVLPELVRKEILEVHTDRLSAEHGQYRFVQSLVRTVAYETMSRKDRKGRHLAVARYLEQLEGDEYAAIVARHYLDAVDCEPDGPDARELTGLAFAQLERAARRAEALGSPDEALRHYRTALARDLEAVDRARLLEGAARSARSSNRLDEALALAEQARAAYESLGQPIGAGSVAALMGDVLISRGEPHPAIELMRPFYEQLEAMPGADDVHFRLTTVLGLAYATVGDPAATAITERGLVMAEARGDADVVSRILVRMYVHWINLGCPTLASALLREAVELGRRNHQPRQMIMALLNMATFLKTRDVEEALEVGREAMAMTTHAGLRDLLRLTVLNHALICWVSGDWDELAAIYDENREEAAGFPVERGLLHTVRCLLGTARGEPAALEAFPEAPTSASSVDVQALLAAMRAEVAGDADAAARELARAVDAAFLVFGIDDDFPIWWPVAIEAALTAGHTAEAERLLAYVADAPTGLVTPFAQGLLPRLRALVGAATGAADDVIDADLEEASRLLRDFGARFYLARTLLERGDRATARGDHDAASSLLEEAERIFVELKAARWVAEARKVGSTTS